MKIGDILTFLPNESRPYSARHEKRAPPAPTLAKWPLRTSKQRQGAAADQ
jgi:hypothetical protein